MGVGGEEGSLAANGREDLVSKGLTHSQWEPGGADPAHSIQESQVFKMDGRECGRRKGARGRERDGQEGEMWMQTSTVRSFMAGYGKMSICVGWEEKSGLGPALPSQGNFSCLS